MKTKLLYIGTTIIFLSFLHLTTAQSNVTVENKQSVNAVTKSSVVAPNLYSTACYALFTGAGAMTNVDDTYIIGDVGSDLGAITGYDPLKVTGTLHTLPDASTEACKTDLNIVYTYLDNLIYDVMLPDPSLFGNNSTLIPQVYYLNAATILTDVLFLDAQGNADAVFVFQIAGALSTTINAKVELMNGAQSKNVFWKVNGAVEINTNAEFAGTIVSFNGAISMKKNSKLDGRALTTSGAVNTDLATINMPAGCSNPTTSSNELSDANQFAVLLPNSFNKSLTITVNANSGLVDVEMSLYNSSGKLVLKQVINQETTVIDTNYPTGVYFYNLTHISKTIQSGKLILKQ